MELMVGFWRFTRSRPIIKL